VNVVEDNKYILYNHRQQDEIIKKVCHSRDFKFENQHKNEYYYNIIILIELCHELVTIKTYQKII
jgi:hypothetical protein